MALLTFDYTKSYGYGEVRLLDFWKTSSQILNFENDQKNGL